MRFALRWNDIDANGHLNQAVYHVALEEARAGLLHGLAAAEPGLMRVVMARIVLDHRAEVRRDDDWMDVEVEVGRVGGRSVTLPHRILRRDGVVAAEGRSVMVAWDREERGSRDWTERERALLAGGRVLGATDSVR